jgi:tetratricopeptide (TPR) repeat protein
MNAGYKLKQLDPLSFPRDYHPKCDLTGLRAQYELTIIQNNNPFVLYYSSQEIAEQAYEGIIKKIVHLLIPLTSPAPIIGTSEERSKREKNIIMSKRSLVDFCLSESSNLLSVQKYSLAVPAATQALKFCKEIDGEKSVAVIEPYLQLAQAYLGLNEHGKSEEFLSLARWIALSAKDCSDGTRYRLHMLMGRVNTVRGNFDPAKTEFASSIYYAACCFGAEAIPTSIGYFRLGDVFLGRGNVECALAFFDKVVDIWYKYLSALHASAINADENHEAGKAANNEPLSEEYLADGHGQLEQVLDTRRRLLGIVHIATGEAQFTLGLFELYLIGNMPAASAYITSAQRSYESQLGADHPSAVHVTSCLELLSMKLQSEL